MNDFLEVSFEQLLKNKFPKKLVFKTTEEVEDCDRLIGQDSAERAMEFGVSIRKKGYNIYISGKNGTGRTRYAREILEQVSQNSRVPDDWCYVYNFINEYEPVAINLLPGMGRIFKQDMEYIVDEIIKRIPSEFDSEEYDRQKNEILEDFHDQKNNLVDKLSQTAEEYNLQVKATSTGFAFIPIIDGKPMSEGEYDNLDKDNRDAILKSISAVRIKAIDILRKLKVAEKDGEERVKRLDKEIGCCVIENLIMNFRRKYSSYDKIMDFIEHIKEDVLENLDIFVEGINKHSLNKDQEELLSRYKVNLIVDNSQTKGAPVIHDSNPTYNNLIGNVEYESRLGTITTDFLMIRAGSILKANGGYLIVKLNDLLRNYRAWEGLKRVLGSGELKIEGIRSQLDLLTITSIKPETIPMEVKVVLIGTEYLYQLLHEYDDEFCDLFKIKVQFDTDMDRNEENIYKIAGFIGRYCRKNNIRHLDNSGVAAIVEYSSRVAGSRKKLSTCLENIIDIVEESNIWAQTSGRKYISFDIIKKAIQEKKKRMNLVEEKTLNNYRNNKIIIDVKDEAVGQVNGLAVVEVGGYSFGKPYRITASTYMGKSGIINIEREVQMSGNIHNKSVMIITGYLGQKYARNIPMSLTAHICFEQLYGYIDGDSASIAELYAVLSSLSGIPLKQGIAVTGSLNQMGDVQPVGGINEKIEGFYNLCSLNGLTKKQGIIIPYQNIDDILLDDNIIKDIKNGLFHIYAIKNVEEGIEILTGMAAGAVESGGRFQKDTFNYYVDRKLREFIENYNKLDELKPVDKIKNDMDKRR